MNKLITLDKVKDGYKASIEVEGVTHWLVADTKTEAVEQAKKIANRTYTEEMIKEVDKQFQVIAKDIMRKNWGEK